MGLTITIAGSPVSFVEKSLKVSAKVNQRSSCTFTVLDTSGTAVFRKGQSVVVSDSVLGVLYAGFVNKPKVKNLYPNRHNLWTIDCVDMIWLADKRSSNSLYVNQYAGTIVCDQVQRILASEGVWGNFALGYHHQLTDWANTQVYGSDTFARSNQTGLGTASDTQVWAKIGTGTMTAAISGNEGTLTGAASSDTIYQLGSKAIADAEAVFRFKVTNTANDIIGPALRIQDANNWYRARLFNGNLTLVKMVTGVVSTFGQVAFAATNATFYWMRYRIVGPNHYLKAWADGTTEPVDWNVTAADSSIMVTGGFGLEGWSSSSMDVLTFDSLTVQAAGNTIATTTNGDGNPGDGDLELAPAGLAVAKSESTTSDWNTNLSMTGLDATGNMLQLASHATLAFEGVNGGNYGSSFGNAFAYQQIWNGSYTIVAGDVLQYSVWISSSSPQIMAGVDVIFSDGSTLRDSGAVDQNGINAHPNADLVGFANDQWYTRTIWLGSRVGKTTQLATLGFEGDNAGQYTAYFRDITIVNGSTTKATLYQGATPHAAIIQPQSNVKIAANGYSNVTVIPVIGYESSGTRSANATSLTDVGLYQSSTINWTEVIPTTAVGSTTAVGTITINTSIDGGATWQPATLNTPIAHLVAGASLVGQTLQTQQILTLTAKDPTASPSLALVSWSVLPSYVASKSDIRASYTTAADWASGTLTNLTSANQNLTINSSLRNWDDASIANQTLFGSASPVQGTYKKQGTLTSSTGADVRARLDFAGNWQNFTMSVDLQITSANQWSGLVYRTTGWVNGNDTYAYKADVNLTGIFLGKATNGGASSRTALGSAVLSLTAGDWHTLTVTVNGSQHQVYLDGVLYINVVDSTYTATGQIGIVLNNFTGSTQTAYFDNFGVMPVAAITPNTPLPKWVSPSIALGSLTVGNSIIQWNVTQPNGSIVNVLASVNGGAYTACTNGAVIPGLTAGTVLTSGTVQLQVQVQAAQASAVPSVQGLTVWVLSAYSSSGTWTSPVLSLARVANAATSLVNWNAHLPNGNTSLAVATSIDNGSTYQTVASAGNPIPNITLQPDPAVDTFAVDTSADYTQTNFTGGGAASWTWDTANLRLTATQTTGIDGVLEYTGLTGADMQVMADFNYSDSGGLVARMVDASHAYFLSIADASASSSPNTAKLYKITGAGGGTTPLTLYYSNAPASVSTDDQLYTALGTPTLASPTTLIGTATGWGQIYPQGNAAAWPALSSIGAPDDHGFLFDATTLEGQQFVAGNWTGAVRLACAGVGAGTLTADMYVRVSKRSASGIFTLITDMVLVGASISTTTNYAPVSTTGANSAGFVAGDKLAINIWLHVTANTSTASTANVKLNALSMDTAGKTGVANGSVVTPGYQVSGGGSTTLLGSAAISFNRDTYHRFVLNAQGTTISASMDGTQLLSVADSSITATGGAGILAGMTNGQHIQCYQFRVQPYGQNVSALSVLTKLTLTSTDPTVTPQVLDCATLVADPTIGSGVLVPSAQYQGTYVSKNIDDCNRQSDYWWDLTTAKQFLFQAQDAAPAPWILQSSDPATTNILVDGLQVEYGGDLYRNRMVLLNVNATSTQPQLFAGDGQSRSWTLTHPVAANTVPTISLNGRVQSLGLKGIDTGKAFYYQVGKTGIDQDSSQVLLTTLDQLVVTYTGSYTSMVTRDNTGQFPGTVSQAQYAALDGTSGIVEVIEDLAQDVATQSMDVAAAEIYGDSQLSRYGVIGRTVTFKTLQSGLQVGQQLTAFIPAHQMNNVQLLVSQIDRSEMITMQNGVAVIQYWYVVTAVEGPALDHWTKLFARLLA